MVELADIQAAAQRVSPYVKRTPLVPSRTLSELLGTSVYLKLELFQKTGSFKPRGAFNQILQRLDETRQRGVVAISGGNFAQGVAYAANRLGIPAVVCMPEYTPANYLEATRGYGARVELAPDFAAGMALTERFTAEGYAFLHPYDNANQMAGTGTLGLEMLDDLPEMTDVIISIGGGGLIGGITVAIKSLKPVVRVWGVETEGTPTMGKALEAGQVVQVAPNSLAKTLGAPYIAEDALRIAQQHFAGYIAVSDQEAIDDQRFLLERAKVLTELAASCTLSAARRIRHHFRPDDHLVLLLCGGNESLANMIGYAGAAH
jgi:threonine dehydratase